jgi:4-amino-4-deoxy-L-arabinose transferase-like glycosyltransferase
VTVSATTIAPPGQPSRQSGPASRLWQRPAVLASAFAVILAAGIALRLWHLASSPAWQWDETVYWRVAVNVRHGMLSEHPIRGVAWTPFLYQPPFYLLILAKWFSLTGATIYRARILGVIMTAGTLIALFRLLWKIHGPAIALIAITPIVFDGWLLYIERVSYIENALMLVIVIALLLYQHALERPSWQRFALAGAAIGVAAIFKQTGAYVLLATLLCWLIIRRDHKGHLLMTGVALTIVVAYLVTMTSMYNLPGHPWFTSQSLVQIQRVLGIQQSGGTLTSPGKLVHLLAAQYGIFVPSLLSAFAATLIALRRLLACYRARNWVPARDNALCFAWLASGVIIFGLSSLKFPQYFVLILVPAYCFLWTEVTRWDWRTAWKAGAVGAATLAGLGSFALAVPSLSVNTLAEVQQYAATRIPRTSLVVTEQTIGDLISQPWCTVEYAEPCLTSAASPPATPTYAITWTTYLQSSFNQGDRAFHDMMLGAVPVASFSGAVGTATVWRLRGTP